MRSKRPHDDEDEDAVEGERAQRARRKAAFGNTEHVVAGPADGVDEASGDAVGERSARRRFSGEERGRGAGAAKSAGVGTGAGGGGGAGLGLVMPGSPAGRRS